MSQQYSLNIQEENDLQKLIDLVLKNYRLFIVSVIIGLSIAFVINKYTIPAYQVSSSILINKEDKQQGMSDFISTNLFGTDNNFQNEMLMIKSSEVFEQTVKNLELPVTYYVKKDFRFFEVYKNVPFKVMYERKHIQPLYTKFQITFRPDHSFELNAEAEEVHFYNYDTEEFGGSRALWTFNQIGKPGKLIETPDLSFFVEIDSSKLGLLEENKTYYFTFTDINSLVQSLKGQVKFDIVDLDATAIQVSMQTQVPAKGLDILTSIANVYSSKNLEKKNHYASITSAYIDKQLGIISDSLQITEQKLQRFRSSNQLLNITEQSTGITNQYRELETQRAEVLTKKRYYDYVANFFDKNEDLSTIAVPSFMGVEDPLLNNLMSELITAQNQKNNLIQNQQEKNPMVKRLTVQIDNLKKTISENIEYVRKTTDITLDELKNRISKIQTDISRIPKTETELVGIERKYRLNDAILNFLMQKQAEANINRASNLPDNEVIEKARLVGFGPVSPKKRINYIIAFLLAFVIPLTFLKVRSLISNKIVAQDQIEKITTIPVVGKILHHSRKSKHQVFEDTNSSVAESFRALRTNVDYYAKGTKKKVILVTSCVEGEGKSFTAVNIAMSYAQMNKRVILLDFDLRKPNKYFNNANESLIGMSSYFVNKATLEDIIIQGPNPRMDFIPSGPVPPNPVELLGLEKTEKLINFLKERYDYIIIDTPPVGQVTDPFLLMDYADLKLLICRYNYSQKNILSLILKDLQQKKVDNICIVLNDNKLFHDQYGYGYGYGPKNKNKA
jgi:tyrosine-protein kinase Etk/Wzc